MEGGNKKKGKRRLLLYLLFFSISCLLLSLLVYHCIFAQKIYPGVFIANINLGGRTEKEAEKILREKFPSPEEKITLVAPNQKWQISLAELEIKFEATASARRAFQFGRRGNLWENWWAKTRALLQKEHLPPVFLLNHRSLEKKVLEFAALVDNKPISSTLSFQKNKVKITKSRRGQKLDRAKLLLLFYQRLEHLEWEKPIILPLSFPQPSFDEKKAQVAGGVLQLLEKKPLILRFQKLRIKIDGKKAIEFFPPEKRNAFLNREKVAQFVTEIGKNINRSPQDAVFQFKKGRVVVFKPSLAGYQLEEEKTIRLIENYLTSTFQLLWARPISLPVKITKPKITTDQVNNLGIKEMVGRGVSYFRGSIEARIHNIERAVGQLNGVLIPPGEIFSFNQTLGEVSQKTGYKQAYIIKEGRTILDDGGGVCQVSTTLFRAVLKAGLPILERTAHAYRVSYYEQNSPVGLDATVYAPTVDLKFKNDTPGYLLIQARVEKEKALLVFELYGTDDGRKIEIGQPIITNQIPPPKPIYHQDPSLPKGVIRQIDWPAWGATVKFSYKVTRGSKILQDQVFVSRYRPWQAIYLVGTKEKE